MTVIYLVRHGQAETGWTTQQDPGLSDLGRQQARAAAQALSERGSVACNREPVAQNSRDGARV